MKTLIVGCGYVGSMLAGRLMARGYSVWGLRRNVGALPEGVIPVRADLCGEEDLSDLPQGVEVIVFSVAAGGRGIDYRDLYVGGLMRLMGEFLRRETPLRRVLFVSSTGVYGQRDGRWVDEGSLAVPRLATGKAMLEAEAVLHDLPYASVAIRFSGIYGPGRIRLISNLLNGSAQCPRDPPRYLNQIHRDDCVGVIEHMMHAEVLDDVVLASDNEPMPRWDVLSWLAERLDVEGPRENPDGNYPGFERGNKRCRNDRLRASGYRFLYPTFREGYEVLLDGL